MKHILSIGNEFLEEDNLAIKVAKNLDLPGFKFHIVDVDEVTNFDKPVILDVVKGLKQVRVFDDVDKFKAVKSVSAHDLDLGFHLKLLKEMGELKDIRIIGLPQNARLEEMKKSLPIHLKKMC